MTGSEMHRWCTYFHDLITSERAATTELVRGERAFVTKAVATALAEYRHEIEDGNKEAIRSALACVQSRIDAMSEEITKRAAVDTGRVIDLPNPLTEERLY